MGEYSTVIVETRTDGWTYDQAEAFGKAIELALDWRFELVREGSWDDPDDTTRNETGWNVRWEEDQARYGFDYDGSVQRLIGSITEAKIRWWALDYGSWDWGETEYSWQPGMERPAHRYQANEQPCLTKWEFDHLREKFEVDDIGSAPWCLALVRAIEEHFGDIPNNWVGA